LQNLNITLANFERDLAAWWWYNRGAMLGSSGSDAEGTVPQNDFAHLRGVLRYDSLACLQAFHAHAGSAGLPVRIPCERGLLAETSFVSGNGAL
jgi:hypothetical protein